MSRTDQVRAEAVLEVMLAHYGLSRPAEITSWLDRRLSAPVRDLEVWTGQAHAAADLRSPLGRFRFRVHIEDGDPARAHPMVELLRVARDALGLGSEIEHPLENDDRDGARQYSSVVTVRSVANAGIALSSETMPFHQDALGTAGAVRFIAMCLDSGPVGGGHQSYANVLAHGLLLADSRWSRFVEATRADALEVRRISGSHQVSTTGPMFYVDETGLPCAHFRSHGGEYRIQPSRSVGDWFDEFALSMAADAQPEKIETGDCLVVDNIAMVHARAGFTDSAHSTRRLSRKWYAIDDSRKGLNVEPSFRLNAQIYGPTANSEPR